VKRSLFIQELKKIEAKQTRLIPKKGKIKAEKNELDLSKTNSGGILKHLWSPGINSKEFIPPAYALAGWSPYL
jgi:hypothetical protein